MVSLPPTHVGRSVRWGGLLIVVGAVQFAVANAVVQSRYAGYSLLTNYISDLGNTSTSPLHIVFNISIILLGLLAFFGILLAWGGFPRGGSRVVGLFLLLIASVAAILVGLFPENVNATVHDTASLLVFLPGGLALVILSSGMSTRTMWYGYRAFSLVLGLVVLLSLAYYAPTQTFSTTWDPGLIERLIVYPILLWAVVVGLHLARMPRFSALSTPPPI
ncbi:MAG TPA: DUF998 domain-containing protein [Thermoplasmata archaeon]|jgi:hypothetical membrane protein|nr:DUF998 domain-containing protein [Thermoplasmata archaeon]